MADVSIKGTPYVYDDSISKKLSDLADRVKKLREQGTLSDAVLDRIRRFFKTKSIYHLGAIEGNKLTIGETRLVVEEGLTLTGNSLKDQAEARNLSHALDYLEQLASSIDRPITGTDVRHLHDFVLRGLHDEAGSYRSVSVKISGSNYEVCGPEAVPSQMEVYNAWLANHSRPTEREFASIDGLLVGGVAHTWFVLIHPFIDGNGRVARLLLYLTLIRHGFPIAIITKEDRLRYYDALEKAQESDLTPLLLLLTECVSETMEAWELAVDDRGAQQQWIGDLPQQYSESDKKRLTLEFEVWSSAMYLLRNFCRQTIGKWNDQSNSTKIELTEFGVLDLEKYLALRIGHSVKRTWFFSLEFTKGSNTVRYLFFFDHASRQMREHCLVTLQIAQEAPPQSFNYEKLDDFEEATSPNLREIGYVDKEEKYATRSMPKNIVKLSRLEKIGNEFFEGVFKTI